MFPAGATTTRRPDAFEEGSRRIAADSSGYVQTIGVDVLMRIATKKDLILRIDASPGQFVTKGARVITAYPLDRVSDEIEEDLRGTVVIGRDRTPYQDLEFAIRRIVELAQRSLSTGINDPTTALYCIDRLGEVLGRLAGREIPSPMRLDKAGHLRVLTDVVVLGDLARRAFAAIARYGIADADVVARLVETLAKLEISFPPSARHAISEFREQVQSASQGPAVHRFDRETNADLQEANKKAL